LQYKSQGTRWWPAVATTTAPGGNWSISRLARPPAADDADGDAVIGSEGAGEERRGGERWGKSLPHNDSPAGHGL